MVLTVYHYPRCGTCKKALKWLELHGIEHRLVDIVESPPSKTKLRALWKSSGLAISKLFNTSGQSYRAGDFKQRLPKMTDAEALTALADDGKLIKRPLAVEGDVVLIGFKEADWEAALLR